MQGYNLNVAQCILQSLNSARTVGNQQLAREMNSMLSRSHNWKKQNPTIDKDTKKPIPITFDLVYDSEMDDQGNCFVVGFKEGLCLLS